ncbi:MAG: HlyD family efflux transporter periplasmic adaptor subunit [Polyangiales bacterium]
MKSRLVILFLAGLAGACSDAFAHEPEPFQGIVEHEDRILGFEVGGRVSDVSVRRGDVARAGQVLVKLDDSLERPLRDAKLAEVAGAEAQLALLESGARAEEIRGVMAEIATVEAQAELTQRQRDRQNLLVERGALPPATLDELEGTLATLEGRKSVLEQRLHGLRRGARPEELEAAEARLRAASAGLVAVETRLSRYGLASPVDLYVTDVHALPGEMVAPGAPAVTLADLDHPYVDVFVPESRMSDVEIGQRARVRVDGLRQALTGHVEHVSHRTEFTPRYLFSESERPNLVLRVRVRIDDPSHRLRAGVPAFVLIEGVSPSPQATR